MNYRHAYHAGNFADVHKHVALVAILLHLRRKESPFAVIDTHAGAGLYDLSAEAAQRTREAGNGIALLRGHAAQSPALAEYLKIADGVGAQRYPGSPPLAARLLRPQDRLIAVEKHADEYPALRIALSPFANARPIAGDGYLQLPTLLPPAERRGVVLIDPPYEEEDELQRIAKMFGDNYRRFTNGIYLIWQPLKDVSSADALAGELRNAGATKVLSLAFDVGRAPGDPAGKLSASGLLIVNPPYGFDGEMRATAAEILPLLRRGTDARTRVEWLAGGP
ncbi:MAG: 23S rRNA (adenine(2030)-N(6))-methyltransferase RlmJ [Alphaproteobacteria bacterium]